MFWTDGQVIEQPEVLEHHADARIGACLGEIADRPHRGADFSYPTYWPSTLMSPQPTCSRWPMSRSSVLLPEPLGPMIVTTSPRWTVRPRMAQYLAAARGLEERCSRRRRAALRRRPAAHSPPAGAGATAARARIVRPRFPGRGAAGSRRSAGGGRHAALAATRPGSQEAPIRGTASSSPSRRPTAQAREVEATLEAAVWASEMALVRIR